MLDMVTGLELYKGTGDEMIDGVDCYNYIGRTGRRKYKRNCPRRVVYERNYTDSG
jgi:hypothetical protein